MCRETAKRTMGFCPLSGTLGMRETMVTMRRSFLAQAGAGGLALAPIDQGAAAAIVDYLSETSAAK